MNQTTEIFFEKLQEFPCTTRLVKSVIEIWPAHFNALEKSILSHDKADMPLLERLSDNILLLTADNLTEYLDSYRWMCEKFNEEQLFFFRHKRYRCSSFEEANTMVYSDTEFMKKYMEGLLVSQLYWHNHAKSYIFHSRFIDQLEPGFSYLEVGPGHGLYLSAVTKNIKCGIAEAWDFSQESLKQTNDSLVKLGVTKSVALKKRDVQEDAASPPDVLYDSIVISEVLEHLENPHLALKNLRKNLAPKGQIMINFPINSPAPDHIFLLESVDAVVSLVESSGFKVNLLKSHSASGYSLERAMQIKATVSVLITAS
jgi:2-polyprenyl-3-methyl-5-hydroxy-6-metoxy-1,4-benzoquinol methylase